MLEKSKELKESKQSFLIVCDKVEKLKEINKTHLMMMEFMEKKFLALKQIVVDELPYDPVIEHELAFEEFMWAGLERSKLASIIEVNV